MSRIGSLFVLGCLALEEQDTASLLQKQPTKNDQVIRPAAAEAMIQRSHDTHTGGATSGIMDKSLSWKRSCPQNITMTINKESRAVPEAADVAAMTVLSTTYGPMSWSKIDDFEGHPQYQSPIGSKLYYQNNHWHIVNGSDFPLLISPADSNYDCHDFDGNWHGSTNKTVNANVTYAFHFNEANPREVTTGDSNSLLALEANGYKRRFHWTACNHNQAFFTLPSLGNQHAAAVKGMEACNSYRLWCDFYVVSCSGTPNYPWDGAGCGFTLYSMTNAPTSGTCTNCGFTGSPGETVYFKDEVARNKDYWDDSPHVDNAVKDAREATIATNTACPIFSRT